jgi:POT family proton-dependent oligopeptide transporter
VVVLAHPAPLSVDAPRPHGSSTAPMSAPAPQPRAATASGDIPHKHPPGLYLLFTTEMWERMSFYGMRALLTLYMVAAAEKGGFGWSKETALSIYGTYTGLVYLTPLLGGYLADRYLGQRRSTLIGGALMMIGHFLMAVPGVSAFYAALGFLIIGNGLFKPNISTMVGGLYEEGDPRRDGAFTIFYMGINVGAWLASAVCGTLGEKLGYDWGFGSAGVGMGLGLVIYIALAQRLLGDIGKHVAKKPEEQKQAEPDKPLTREEIDRIVVIVILALFVVFFWTAFEQAGGLMNLYTDEKVNRMVGGFLIPTTWFQSVNPAFIVLFAPVFSALWTRLGEKGKDPSIPTKMGIGLLLLSFGFVLMLGASKQSDAEGKAALMWVVGAYFFHTMGELCLSPVGLSMVTKLAPKRYASLLMGVWFLANAIANKLAGFIGGFADKLGEFKLFAVIVVFTAVAGALLVAIAGPLRRMMHGADAIKTGHKPQAEGDEEPAPAH